MHVCEKETETGKEKEKELSKQIVLKCIFLKPENWSNTVLLSRIKPKIDTCFFTSS